MFKDKFEDNTPDVKKPEITNGLDPILAYPLPPDENVEPPTSVKRIATSPRSPNASLASSSSEESIGATSFTLPTIAIDPEKGKKLKYTPSPALQSAIRMSTATRYKPSNISIPEDSAV